MTTSVPPKNNIAVAAAAAATTLDVAAVLNATQQQQQQRAMQSDEDFNIRFVNLVRTHKCLYDKKVPEYRNRDNQEKAWSLISQETRESVIHCKERWRNLRACLSRYIKQQSGTDPQHKPYYLTEHMAFLLPFLKSTRNSLDCGSSSNGHHTSHMTLFQISQQHQQQQQQEQTPASMQRQMELLQYSEHQLELKHSLSDNDDEETIDAFDPEITATLERKQQQELTNHTHSPARSDTNTLQNFIPDIQLAELQPDEHHPLVSGSSSINHNNFAHEPKRIKTERNSHDTTNGNGAHYYDGINENADMEFFRSILPDIAALTPQQKRKFKIGILELIDGVVERYPDSVVSSNHHHQHQNRSISTREWRK